MILEEELKFKFTCKGNHEFNNFYALEVFSRL